MRSFSRDRFLHCLVQLEHSVEIAHLKDSTNPRRRYNHPQVPIEESSAFQGADDDSESEGVDEVDSAEIEHQTTAAFADLCHHVLSQLRPADDVELPHDRGDRPRPLVERLNQLHPRNRTGPARSACAPVAGSGAHCSRYMAATDDISGSLRSAPTTETSVRIT